MTDDEETNKLMAKMIAAVCVRNTCLEDLHAGKTPVSKTGDYSDVKVITPDGEIPWNEVSRFNNQEMKTLMREVVDKLYSFHHHSKDPEFMSNFLDWASYFIREWDDPKLDKEFDELKKKTFMFKNANLQDGEA